jgi:hypothetical protein
VEAEVVAGEGFGRAVEAVDGGEHAVGGVNWSCVGCVERRSVCALCGGAGWAIVACG